MRWSVWIVGALVALSVRAQEGGHEGEAANPAVEATGGETTLFCTSSMKVLMAELETLFSHDEYNTTINCLAFGPERTLEGGVLSVFPLDGTTPGRYNLTCQKNALKARQLIGLNASSMDIGDEDHHACLECRPTEVPEEICHQPCSSECERCATIGVEVRCTECYEGMYRLLNSYPARSTLTAEQIEREREELPPGEEEECMDFPDPDPENPANFHCVAKCPEGGNHSEPSEEDGKTCFACGLEYCVECELNEAPGHNECIRCMTDTVLFDGECYACPRALIVRTAIVQEAEEAREARAQRLRQIELAVSLPVVCLLVIFFFLAMSVYAHHRYPHISHRGHKRHRNKPDKQDMFTKGTASPTPSAESELPPLPESEVWRAQPSIRFR